jgi:hypothetical protein
MRTLSLATLVTILLLKAASSNAGIVKKPYDPNAVYPPRIEYVVEKGDNLWKIGEYLSVHYTDFTINYLDIAKQNNLKIEGILQPGQRLKIQLKENRDTYFK